jgi:hypothetical protein
MADGILNFQSVSTGALNISLWIIGILFFIGVMIGIYFLLIYFKKYSQFKVVIWDNDGFGKVREKYDSAGIFVDKKTNTKRLWLRKAKIGLDCEYIPDIPCEKSTIFGFGKSIVNTVYLIKIGEKNYRFVQPEFKAQNFGIKVSDEDVNWAINDYEKAKAIYNKEGLMKYLPAIVFVVVIVVIMIILISFFKEMGTMKDVASSFKTTAEIMAKVYNVQMNGTSTVPINIP